jgi:RNA polymerase sigma factor (sigma-70 family)
VKAAAFAVRTAARREFAEIADAELLRRFAAGKDHDAFAELVRRYGPLVWRVARNTAGSVAEDVFQATFLTLSKTAASVRDPAALAGWQHRTAYRTATRARKAEAKRTLPRPLAEPGTAIDPLDALTARELLAAVDEELAALPDALRAAVVLCGVEGLSQDEAATRLGWTPGSVKGRLERGRAKLLARRVRELGHVPRLLGRARR